MKYEMKKTGDAIEEVKKVTAIDFVYWILVPSPAAAWDRFILLLEKPIMRVSFFGHIGASLLRVLAALLAAWTLGISFGVLIGWNRKMDAFFGSIFSVIRPIPPIAWIPLITICFGIGEFPKILIVFIGAVMPVVINTHDGLKNVQKLYLDVGEVFNANKRQMLTEIAIPAAYPSISPAFGLRQVQLGW